MIVKAIYKDKHFNYFRDLETNDKRMFGDIFECDDALAEERIAKGLVKKANKKEEAEYLASLETNDEKDINNNDFSESDINKDNFDMALH